LKFKLKNKFDNFEWTLIVVYGAAQEEEKENESFFARACASCFSRKRTTYGWGDFNFIGSPQEKIMIDGHSYLML
jgi:hypothetical protein